MKVEILIFAYLAVCFSMIVFNIVCIFVFKRRDKKLHKSSINFSDLIQKQMQEEKITDRHKAFLRKKLRKVGNLMAFDETLTILYREKPEEIVRYLQGLHSVFIYLTLEYQRRGELLAAYFPYIIKKYQILKGTNISMILDILVDMAAGRNLYCRENALQALYSIGNAKSVVAALTALDRSGNYHHNKLITDGLLNFTGDTQKLGELLWAAYPRLSAHMRVAILDYFRFFSGDYSRDMLRILQNEKENDEARYSCIRYFARYYYEPAFPVLCELAERPTEKWEYHAITASALGKYPCRESERILKDLLLSRNWYVCNNAAESLERLGIEYDELIDIFEGSDRLAGDVLRYRLDHKKLLEKKEAAK